MSLAKRVFSERRAVMIPLVLLLVGNLAVLGLVVWPLQNVVAGAQDEHFRAAADLQAARKAEADAKANRVGKERADTELKTFYTGVLPRDDREAVAVANFWLGQMAEDTRVLFKVGQWDRDNEKGSRLSKVTGNVTLIGEYANIRRFLYEVETAQEFVIIESVKLSEASTSQTSNLLELSLEVATYYVNDLRSGAAR